MLSSHILEYFISSVCSTQQWKLATCFSSPIFHIDIYSYLTVCSLSLQSVFLKSLTLNLWYSFTFLVFFFLLFSEDLKFVFALLIHLNVWHFSLLFLSDLVLIVWCSCDLTFFPLFLGGKILQHRTKCNFCMLPPSFLFFFCFLCSLPPSLPFF